MNSSYILTSAQLKKFNEKAHEEKQNRILPIKDAYSSNAKDEELDDTMVCIVRPTLFHTNHAGSQSWRCGVTYGVKNNEEPRQAYLDVSLTLLDELKKNTLQTAIVESLKKKLKARR